MNTFLTILFWSRLLSSRQLVEILRFELHLLCGCVKVRAVQLLSPVLPALRISSVEMCRKRARAIVFVRIERQPGLSQSKRNFSRAIPPFPKNTTSEGSQCSCSVLKGRCLTGWKAHTLSSSLNEVAFFPVRSLSKSSAWSSICCAVLSKSGLFSFRLLFFPPYVYRLRRCMEKQPAPLSSFLLPDNQG